MKKIVFFFIGFILASCTSRTILKKPKDLIPKDTMVLLLTDLFIAKSAFAEKNVNNLRKVNYIPFVYNKYKIDSTRFKNSNLYYTSVFDEYELIYQKVKVNLEAKKSELEKRQKPSKKDKEAVKIEK